MPEFSIVSEAVVVVTLQAPDARTALARWKSIIDHAPTVQASPGLTLVIGRDKATMPTILGPEGQRIILPPTDQASVGKLGKPADSGASGAKPYPKSHRKRARLA